MDKKYIKYFILIITLFLILLMFFLISKLFITKNDEVISTTKVTSIVYTSNTKNTTSVNSSVITIVPTTINTSDNTIKSSTTINTSDNIIKSSKTLMTKITKTTLNTSTTTNANGINYTYGDFIFYTSKRFYNSDDRSILVYVRRIDGSAFNYGIAYRLYYENNGEWLLVPHKGGNYTYNKVLRIANVNSTTNYAKGSITVNFNSFDFEFKSGNYKVELVNGSDYSTWGVVFFEII